jgi:hypothetical protein
MITHQKLVEIEKNIAKDIEQEFNLILKEISFLLNQNFDLYFLKEFVRYYPPKAVRDRAEVLLETLLNYFMKDLIEDIKKLDSEKQYQFFKYGLRDKIKEGALKKLNELIPVSIKIQEDKRFEERFPIIGSVALTFGGIGTAVVLPESLLIKSIPAASSVVASLYLLKSYKDRARRIKRKWKKEITKFINHAKTLIISWLEDTKKDLIFEINKIYNSYFLDSTPHLLTSNKANAISFS